jgi:DNA helicase-2/ATP-dependent DNA helicase PcrA
VEAPAGCGKTHQGADYAREMADVGNSGRLLILTHTHAACSMFSDRTKGVGSRIEIRTIDSVIGQIASAYHAGLGLPTDIAGWVRQRKEGYAELALKVAALLNKYPMIAFSLVQRHPIVICDEHQDSSGNQHSVVMALLGQGAKLRVFADPMQKVFKDKAEDGGGVPWGWKDLAGRAQAFEQLDVPHRWAKGCPHLGQWTLKAREALKTGGRVDLRSGVPPSVSIIFAENQAHKNFDYRLSEQDRKPVDAFEKNQGSLLVLTHYNDTARSLRSFFNRRIPLWEGHTRTGLESLIDAVRSAQGDSAAVAAAVVAFMGNVGKGFSPSAFGDKFEREAREGCIAKRSGKPAKVQELARFLVADADHRGVANMLRRLCDLKAAGDSDFADIEIDCYKEFWDAIRLGGFEEADVGLAEITHHRSYCRPKPPDKAISTVHKAKGLECGSVVIMPCDAKTFPDKPDTRCLLYVAMSRAKDRLMLVISRNNPSPLLDL